MSDTLRRSFVLLLVAAAAMAALLGFLPAAGHDQLWFLLMARRWLDGATLYGPQIFDSNPPMIVWLSAVPAALSHLVHLPATCVAKTLVLVLGAAIARFCARLLPRCWRPVLASEWPALTFAFITLVFVVPARDLGQRDQLVALLVLPYVLCSAAAAAAVSPRARIAAALLAALGFCLKPQDAIIAIAVECALILRARRLSTSWQRAFRSILKRPEPPILLASGLLYLLAIRLLAPLYFTAALPLVYATYWAIGHLSLPQLLWEGVELIVLIAITSVVVGRSRKVSPPVPMLLVAGLGALAAYLVQGTGWYYQQLPAITLVGAGLALHLLDLQQQHPRTAPRWLLTATATVAILAVALTAWFSGPPFTPDRAFPITSPDPSLFRGLPPAAPVAILTTSVDEAMMPVERYHLVWAQRTDNLWLLPAILRAEGPTYAQQQRRLTATKLRTLDALQHHWMLEDLQRWQPKLILVERCQDAAVQCQELEDRHDDLLAWFLRDPALRNLWAQYQFTGTHGRFDGFVLRQKTP